MAKNYTQAEVDALLARASGADPATRPYRVIKDSEGNVLCYPPAGTPNAVAGHNGPWTINDEHPDDYHNVGDDGVAGSAKAAAAPKAADTSPVAKAAASAADDAEYQQYLKDKAARDTAAGGTN